MFKKKNFCITGITGNAKSDLVELIEDNGGEVHKTVKKDTHYLITNSNTVDKNTATVQKAVESSIPVLSEDFVKESVDADKILDTAAYEFETHEPNSEDTSAKKRKKEEESDVAVEEEETTTKKKKVVSKGAGPPVDEDSGLADEGTVLIEGDSIFSATLQQANVGNNNNKFYLIQLIESNGKYYVFNKWGRTGAKKPRSKLFKHNGDLKKAKADFEKKFSDKSGNDWSKRTNFKFKKGKYDLVHVDYSADTNNNEDEGEEEDKPIPDSKLDTRLQELIKFISNKSFIADTMREFELDIDKLPLGKLSKAQIQNGYGFLTRIQDALDGKSDEDLEELSSRFYTCIPHASTRRLPTIDNRTLLKKKIELVESLGQLELVSKVLTTKQYDINPIDQVYNDLHVDLTPVDKTTEEWKWIETYIANTHGSTHYMKLKVMEVFKVKREGEVEGYSSKYSKLYNKQLLFHGSRSTNWAGILSKGLLIAPPEAPATGYMFGKGIYFADMVSKSANYCHSHLSNNQGLFALTEVALGQTYNRLRSDYITKLPQGYHSCWGQGETEPDTQQFVEIDSVCEGEKVKVPLGKPVIARPKGDLLYNEFIVYDTAQVCLRYLVKCSFN
ncbi:hypothetical protein ABK040_010822 [Willaertia magna]